MQLQCDAVEGGVLYPEEVSAYILAELLSSAQAYLGSPVEKAVISVPAYFGSEQREATIEAGRLAGLTKIKLIRQAICDLLLVKCGASLSHGGETVQRLSRSQLKD